MNCLRRFKKTKIFVMLVLVCVSLWATTLVANAGSCTHGNTDSEGKWHSWYNVYKITQVGSSSAGSHPIMVDGKQIGCHMYYYIYKYDEICSNCGNIETYNRAGTVLHEYVH